MEIPTVVRELVDIEINRLATIPDYDVPAQTRRHILESLGPSNAGRLTLSEIRKANALPKLSEADRVRARIALVAARKVEPFWEQACQETDIHFKTREDSLDIRQQELEYASQRQRVPIEHISVYDVPRSQTVMHILHMAESALQQDITDPTAFAREANEWWQIYPRPEFMEREFFIKWAAQEALYEALGISIGRYNDTPCVHALLAFAGRFTGTNFSGRKITIDGKKRREYWYWWLKSAIPTACNHED